mmetsp:Transcript_47252/g.78226  ORF Transcript_47252/g.78226 Transcript_47252/m.78226 type:complete len:95 (-) Transcript_47252:150-434(-)
MLSVKVAPLPLSLSNLFTYLLPATAQAYYDQWLEPFNGGRASLEALSKASFAPLLPAVVAAADCAFAASMLAFAMSEPIKQAANALPAAVLFSK